MNEVLPEKNETNDDRKELLERIKYLERELSKSRLANATLRAQVLESADKEEALDEGNPQKASDDKPSDGEEVQRVPYDIH